MPQPNFPRVTIRDLQLSLNSVPVFTPPLSHSIGCGLTVVTGCEGSGKTSLLRILAGELLPSSGSVQCPQDIFWIAPRTEAFDAITALQFFSKQKERFPQFDAALAQRLASAFSLTEHVDKPLYMLSSGSKRKVWLAANFASGASLCLLDDPFGALDKASRQLVLELLQDAAEHTSRAWVMADYTVPVGVTPITELALQNPIFQR